MATTTEYNLTITEEQRQTIMAALTELETTSKKRGNSTTHMSCALLNARIRSLSGFGKRVIA